MSGGPPRRPARPATIEDLLAIPEERRRHELIDGEIHEKGAATGEHVVVGQEAGGSPPRWKSSSVNRRHDLVKKKRTYHA